MPFALGQFVLDRLLPLEQPVHGIIELVRGRVTDAPFLRQGGVAPVAGVGELRAGEEEALDEHGEDQVALS
ncbi:MAG TPA: hypothetical protein VLM40_21585 [Gemmata sp.]|nr:hypothetical protein [Gemmata sp.]